MATPSHSFDIELAEQYGVPEAIMLNHISFWVKFNKKRKKNFKNGCYWMVQTQKDMAAHFPYWSEDAIQRLLIKLEGLELIAKKRGKVNAYRLRKPSEKEDSPIETNRESAEDFRDSADSSIYTDTKEDLSSKEEYVPTKKEEKLPRAENVKVTESNHQTLVKDLGETKAQKAYERLSNWKAEKPKSRWPKNDYAAIRRWVIDALEEEEYKNILKKKRQDYMKKNTFSSDSENKKGKKARIPKWMKEEMQSSNNS